MKQTIKKGRICTLMEIADVEVMTKMNRAKYERLRRLNAPFYLVLRREDEDTVLCVPLTNSSFKHTYAVNVYGISYSAEYLSFISVKDEWLESPYTTVGNTFHTIDQIYRLRERHTKEVIRKNQKKKTRVREDNRLLNTIRAGNGRSYPREKASATVSWKMTHPAQGGRTSPK